MRQEIQTSLTMAESSENRGALPSRAYREIGLAVVAIALRLLEEDLGEELEDAIERGARHLAPLPLSLAS
jgi:hypothetical protein